MGIVHLGQTKLKKVSGNSNWSIFCVVKHSDRQTIIKRHYDRKYIHIQTVMLLNTRKICIMEVINYSKIDIETQF